MTTWLVRRLAVMVVSFVGITFVLFAVIRWYVGTLPGGDQAFREFFQQYDYLGTSIVTEYQTWLGDFLTGGSQSQSLVTGRPALAMVLERVPPTLLLMGSALLIQTAIAVPLGVIAALDVGARADHAIAVFVAASTALPSFLLALIVILIFAVTLRVLPSSGMTTIGSNGFDPIDWLRHLILPASVLASLGLGRVVRYVRAGMLEALSAGYVTTARAKGLSVSRAALRHAFPNAILPLITVLGIQVSVLLGGSFLVELVFGWPGLGRTALDALQATPRDFPVLLAFSAVASIGVLLGGFLADFGFLVVDPTLRAAQLAPVRRLDDIRIPVPVRRLAAVALVVIVVVRLMPSQPGASPAGAGSLPGSPCNGFRNNQPCGPTLQPPSPVAANLCTSVGGKASCTADVARPLPSGAGSSQRPASASGSSCVSVFGAGTWVLTIKAGGVTRTAILHVPPSASTPGVRVPALIVYHGEGALASDMALYTQLSTVADAQDFLVVYPQGMDNVWNYDGFPYRVGAEMEDIDFFQAIVGRLSTSGCVDMSRLYLAGHGDGAGEASFLACRYADLVAGVALVSGAYFAPPCVPVRPVPVIAFQSLNDTTVPYAGGAVPGAKPGFPTVLPVEQFLGEWAALDGCSVTEPASQLLTFGIARLAWAGCAAPVVEYRLPSGGHNWPDAYLQPGANTDLSATLVLLAFFDSNAGKSSR